MVSGVRRASLVLIAGLLCASACVTFSVSPITAPPSPTGSIRPVSAGKGFGLIPDHDGQVVMVDADTDIIRLVLDDGWTWDVKVDSAYLRLSSFGPLSMGTGSPRSTGRSSFSRRARRRSARPERRPAV